MINPVRAFDGANVLKGKSALSTPLSPIQCYGIAVLSVLGALAAGLLLERFELRNISPFLLAITVAAWYGGIRSALLALVASFISFHFFFVEPLHSLRFTGSDLPYFIFFAVLALLVSWFKAAQQNVEGELREANERLEMAERIKQQASLLNLTHDSIFVRNMDFVITYWNQGAQELYGWPAEDAIGKDSKQLLHTVFSTPLDDINTELLRSGRWEGELRRTTANSIQIVVAARWSLQRNDRGEPAAILETSNNITEHKRREQEIQALNQELAKRSSELEAMNKELEAFAYTVSHDLRAPLRHISGYSELLQKTAASILADQTSRRYMTIILESVKRMGSLIDDLLSFSRIGRAETRKSLVNLTQLVKEAVNEIRQQAEGRDVVWKISTLPEFYGDRSMLRLVLINLLSNAVKFTRPRAQPEIEIGCVNGSRGEMAVFVRDNGIGFDMKYVNKLFGVFQRLHSADSFEGTGIGLATVQRIIHRHGGKVWAEGAVDKGATFYFQLSGHKENYGNS